MLYFRMREAGIACLYASLKFLFMKDQRFRSVYSTKAIAMVTVLIFLILISMVSVTSIFLMTSQSRTIEKQIRRIKAFYSEQAAAVQANDELSQNSPLTPNLVINDQVVAISHNPVSVPVPGQLNTTVDYSF